MMMIKMASVCTSLHSTSYYSTSYKLQYSKLLSGSEGGWSLNVVVVDDDDDDDDDVVDRESFGWRAMTPDTVLFCFVLFFPALKVFGKPAGGDLLTG
jgi:hypothetical protein